MPAQQTPTAGIDLAAFVQAHATLLRGAYLLCIAIATLLRLGFDTSVPHALERLQRAVTPTLHFKDAVDAVRNVALFFGWGATFALTSHTPTSRRDVVRATLLGMLASVTVESLQLFSEVRQASIVDVFTNTIGSLAGAVVLWLVEHRAIGDMRRGTMLGVPGWLPAGSALLTAFGLTFAPSSRATMAVGWAASPLERARMIFAGPSVLVPWAALLTDVVAWTVAGLGVAIAISDRTGRIRPRQLVAWLLIAPGLLVAAHLGRAAAGLQRESVTWQIQSVALAVSLAVGLAVVPRWRRRVTARTTRAMQFGLLAAVLGAVMSWSPASWVEAGRMGPALSWQQLLPMASLFQRQDLSSVFLVLQKAGIGAAIGACLAARHRLGAPVPRVGTAVLYATLLEVGQLLVPGRYADVTDILITGAAAGLVVALVGRADRGDQQTEQHARVGLNGRASTGMF